MKKRAFILALLCLASFAYTEEIMQIGIGQVRVEVPMGWYAVYTGSPTVFQLFAPLEANDDFQENVSLVEEKMPQPYTLIEYQDASARYLQTVFGNFQITERKDNYHIYKASMNQIDVMGLQVFYLREKEAYTITFNAKPSTFDRYRERFFAIARSFTY